MRFTFNRKARAIALSAIKKLEGGAFASSVLGAFSANPKVSAISSLVLFILCRIGETVIAGIEDDEKSDSKTKKGGSSNPNGTELDDSG